MDPTLNNKSWLTSSSKKGNWKTKENNDCNMEILFISIEENKPV